MELLLQNLRHGLRRLFRKPAFSLLAILMMALGIGANTTIFSVLNTVLFEPLPFEDSDQLVRVWENNLSRGWPYFSTSESNYFDFRDRNQVFEGLAAFGGISANLTGDGEAARVDVGRGTANLLEVLRLEPMMGRWFTPEEDTYGTGEPVAVLSYDFWQERFAGDPEVLGRILTLNGMPVPVVGVLPDGEYFLDFYDLYAPMAPNPNHPRGDHRIAMAGRLKPDATIDHAREDLGAIATMLGENFPQSNEGWGVTIDSFKTWLVSDDLRLALWIVMGAVAFVLLIACANLANMLLAQATGRRKEIAIYTALGAGRYRVARQILNESLLLAGMGGALGVLLAVWSVDLLQALNPAGVPRVDQIVVNGWVLAFTLAATVIVGILAGTLPALQATRANLHEALKEGSRTATAGRRRNRTRGALVVAEVILSIVLLIGAGLLIRSFLEVQRVEPGFGVERRLTVQLNIPPASTPDAQSYRLYLSTLVDRTEAIPGVTSASMINALPLGGMNTSMEVQAEGTVGSEGESLPSAGWRIITPGYFETMGVPLMRGRHFTDQDDWRSEMVVIISHVLAERLWPDEDPIGKRALLWADPNRIATIVGVVGNMRDRGLEGEEFPLVYLPPIGNWPDMFLVVHTAVEPESIVREVRATVAEIDDTIPLANIQTMEEIVSGSTAGRQFYMLLLTIFAGVAVVLAAAGLYGVMAYAVSERTSEIGIQMALGASPATVLRSVVEQGMVLVAIGLVLGLAAAFGLSQSMSSLLFGIATTDLQTYLGVAIVLPLVALAATFLPALRATRVDPVHALRSE